jgi:hypothetical protein
MSAWVDQALVGAAVLGAIGYFIGKHLRAKRAGKSGCAAGCGCEKKR